MGDAYRFGIEEEYFLADRATGASPGTAAADAFHAAAAESGLPASPELLKGQVEVATEPGDDFAAAAHALRDLRRSLAGLAGAQGLVLFAAGTHPLAVSDAQATTEKTRYQELEGEFGALAHRMMVCATHVHVEVPDPATRVGLMQRLVPYLPLFLALSVGSPFWQGQDTKLDGFRLAAFSQWPRMGLPEPVADMAEFERLVTRLVAASMIKDASYLWWYLRPSIKYPTLEMRICDSCTRVDDVVAIAALYRCLVRAAVRAPDAMPMADVVERAVTAENIWQVQRHGVRARLVAAAGTTSVGEALEAALALVAEDAEALGCAAALAPARAIVLEGAGADLQRAAFRAAQRSGADERESLRAVVDALAEATAG
jgi:carboxylate-amine ligase